MVGVMGAFSASADVAKSGVSEAGRGAGMLEATPESRLGLGGGASRRETGSTDSD